MVRISRKSTGRGNDEGRVAIITLFSIMACLLFLIGWLTWDAAENDPTNRIPIPPNEPSNPLLLIEEAGDTTTTATTTTTLKAFATPSCPYTSLAQLSPTERFPTSGPRHQVDPPSGGQITLVCCQTTKGPWNIAVHHAWAPGGANRFVQMVRVNYFSHKVPLMRCIHNFLCQFGLAGPYLQEFDERLPDDPNWLPEGPNHKTNAQGVKRFARGYLAYAGSGKDSRGVQLIVSLQANPRLGGGSPWEVPWGELVGEHSFTTLEQIYTGYGEKGPSQGRLRREGASPAIANEFPLLDYVTSCQVVDEAMD